jgi:hypothetical protein
MPTVLHVTDRATDALASLARLGEAIEDEWQYVVDLEVAWTARLAEVATARGAEPAGSEAVAAVDQLAEEAALIRDPHRAIDWLSTLPQAVLLALDEPA